VTGERIEDPDVRDLVMLATGLEPGFAAPVNDPWSGSPFRWVLSQPSRTKGAIGEKLVSGWAAMNDFDVSRSDDSDADRIIDGWRVEVKLSTLWRNGGYKFQQIRDQRYDYCLCLGIAPFDAQAWLLPKALLLEHVIGRMGQHTGRTGRDTAWLGFPADEPFPWMEPFGDRLSSVRRLLRDAGHGPHRSR